MPTAKPEPQHLKTFPEADAALQALGQAQREIEHLELDCQRQIDDAKKRLAEARVSADAVVKSTTKLLTQFIKRRRSDIEADGSRTVKLLFGRLGMRTAPPALAIERGFTESDCIHWLRERFPGQAAEHIRVTERLDRSSLLLWEESDLAMVGLGVEQREIVVIEPAVDVPATEVA